jgi:hypothetical protein
MTFIHPKTDGMVSQREIHRISDVPLMKFRNGIINVEIR